MNSTAAELERFLAGNPDRQAAMSKAETLGVPPSRRTSRAAALRALRAILDNEKTHDVIARLASGKK